MYIRCVQCQAATWIKTLYDEGATQTLVCEGCKRSYKVVIPADLGGDSRGQYTAALEFAELQDLDLPSAYSVLLGLMSVDRARGAGAAPLQAPPTGTDRDSDPAAKSAKPGRSSTGNRLAGRLSARVELDYDPGFADAVAEGFLSAKQARERGDRDAAAEQLIRRHQLPRMLAYLVADNKISVAVAIQRVENDKLEAKREAGLPVGVSRQQAIGVAGLAAPILAGILLFAGMHWNNHSAPPPPGAQATAPDSTESGGGLDRPGPRARTAEILRDEEGRMLRIVGRSPEQVLRAFCEQSPAAEQLQALSLAQTIPSSASSRLGVFRDYRDLDAVFAIRIRRERNGRRWQAGDGQHPIPTLRDPRLPDESRQQALVLR